MLDTFNVEKLRQSCASCSIQELCLPAGLASADLERLDRLVNRQKPFKRGDVLFRSADAFNNLFVVRTGTVKTFHQGDDGVDQIMGFHYPGDIIGLDAIHAGQHACTAECLEHTSVCELPFDRLEEVSREIPGLRQQLMKIISREMAQEHRHLLILGKRNAHERLAVFLLGLSSRFESRGFSPTEFQLSMSRNDLANYLGLAVETVSRLFTRFQEQGVLDVERKQVRITDMDGLRQLAGSHCES